MSATTDTKKEISDETANSLIENEKTTFPDNTKIFYSNINQNYHYILNNLISELIKL